MSAVFPHLGDQDAAEIAEWDADPDARGGLVYHSADALIGSLNALVEFKRMPSEACAGDGSRRHGRSHRGRA